VNGQTDRLLMLVGCVKMQDMKMQDVKMKDQVARHENAGQENAGHESARHRQFTRKLEFNVQSRTLSRPSTNSTLKITNRSFRYASPFLWNRLPFLFRQPHFSEESSPSLPCLVDNISSSPVLLSISKSLFHSKLKTYLFHKSFPP